MSRRYMLTTDEQYSKLEPLLLSRMVMVVPRYRSDIPLHDLPERFGDFRVAS